MTALDTWVVTEENTVWIDNESLIWLDLVSAGYYLETLVTKIRDHQIETKKGERAHTLVTKKRDHQIKTKRKL